MIVLDYRDKRPIYEQIVDRMQTLILSGVLEPDEKLPSVRALAVDLSINPNTIQKADSELDRRELIVSVAGKGCFIRQDISSFLFGLRTRHMARFEETVRQMISFGIPLSAVEKKLHQLYANKEEA